MVEFRWSSLSSQPVTWCYMFHVSADRCHDTLQHAYAWSTPVLRRWSAWARILDTHADRSLTPLCWPFCVFSRWRQIQSTHSEFRLALVTMWLSAYEVDFSALTFAPQSEQVQTPVYLILVIQFKQYMTCWEANICRETSGGTSFSVDNPAMDWFQRSRLILSLIIHSDGFDSSLLADMSGIEAVIHVNGFLNCAVTSRTFHFN
jgi:hypothetical protein